MDNIRLILIMALAFISLLLWEAWQEDYVIPQQRAVQSQSQVSEVPAAADTPTVPVQDLAISPEPAESTLASASPVRVRTDSLDLLIDRRGGTVIEARLVRYPVAVDQPDNKIRLMSQDPADYFIAQSGLLSADKERAPTHEALFASAADEYRLGENDDSLVVDFLWTSPDGVRVTKRYTFRRGVHSFDLQHIVDNGSSSAWTGREYRQIKRGEPVDSGNMFMYTFTGGTAYSPQEKYRKFSFDELAEGKPNEDVTDGWVAMIQHYFLAAFIPPRGESAHFYGKRASDGRYLLGSYTPGKVVESGQQGVFQGTGFIGPKLTAELRPLAEGLDLTVDYGWLVVLAKPIHWILEQINAYVGNWGWTIIIFTVLIKLAFYKLSETSYRSMANMRKLGPRIQALKDRYGDDKQRMQQAMMDIYKKEKINPLGGCLPMLVQIPFFIALYWVLLENVEMRQAPWILWIQDLSIKDPYFVLPVIMAASMFVQQKLNPAPPDPMQAKILLYLPLVFGIMFAFFPAGLVLYWVVNNILSIAQQWVITRRIEQGAKA